MIITRAVIMAAGAGSRMNSGTSKPMTKVGNKKLIQYGIDALRGCGVKLIYVLYSTFSEDVLELEKLYEEVTFIKQENVDGSLSTFIEAGKACADPFVMLDCDLILFQQDLQQMLQSVSDRSDPCAYFAIVSNPLPDSPIYVRLSSDRVTSFIKKGCTDSYAGGMIYLWQRFPLQAAMDFYAHSKSLASFFDHLVRNEVVHAMYIDRLWDVDTMDEVLYTERLLEECHGNQR